MKKDKILIIEDDKKIARVLSMELEYEGYEIAAEYTGSKGLERITQENWDIVLLDVMLPELSGLEVLRRVRNANNHVPVILLTARDSIPDKVAGLDLGANDYITKPFQIEELLARIRAVLRVASVLEKKEQKKIFTIEDLEVHVQSYRAFRNGIELELTPREFELLVYLLENKNIVVSREQILNQVWGYHFEADTNIVDVYIRYVRKKVDYPFDRPIIQTVRGIGYIIKDSSV
ncbi:response regulator transcription factor [Bacillus sp. B1-b2]|uniref:response regulator transcription factor n=1 Tax=Bacillus sp. B1-b2 TaxID=2653201 RepID=UPI001261BCB3|nr:response regulator transcription factor [Bacillus sp. B1-b2]KAB7671108.1 response regulator transcription factor [Bacillus sp. B1-b2]